MSDNPKHVTVRLRVPPELRDKIAASSEQYNRSMNADMVARVEKTFNKENAHETEMYLMNVMVKEQQKQIDQLQEMVKQLVFRDRKLED